MSYEPMRVCRELGIPVERMSLRETWGAWIPRYRLIVLATGLTPIQELCTLAHQVEHALAGHGAGCGSGPYADRLKVGGGFSKLAARQERRADREAARKLISDSHLAAVTKWARGDISVAAEKLGVTQRMLRVRLGNTGEEWPWRRATSRIAG